MDTGTAGTGTDFHTGTGHFGKVRYGLNTYSIPGTRCIRRTWFIPHSVVPGMFNMCRDDVFLLTWTCAAARSPGRRRTAICTWCWNEALGTWDGQSGRN